MIYIFMCLRKWRARRLTQHSTIAQHALSSAENSIHSFECKYLTKYLFPNFSLFFAGNETSVVPMSDKDLDSDHPLPNEISAPYEVPQFPIEQIEKKLQIQRHLNVK